jgi:tetratricopeptide (TPR) repeat protein
LGQANTILFSKEVWDKIRHQPEFKTICLGMFEFKNVGEPMEVFAFVQKIFYYNHKEAAALFKKIIDKNPNYAFAHVLYGNLLLDTGNIEGGLAEKRKALSLDPLSAITNYTIARDYWLGRKYDSAMTLIRSSMNLSPRFESNFYVLGELYLIRKDFAKAIEAFSKLPQRPWDQGSDGRVI